RTRPPLLEGDGDRPLLRMIHEPDGAVDLTKHTLERRIPALDEAGIDRAVISLSAPLGIEALPDDEAAELLDAYHDGLAGLIEASGGRLAGWAAPTLAAADGGAATVAGALDRGFAGAMVPSEALCGPEPMGRLAPLL